MPPLVQVGLRGFPHAPHLVAQPATGGCVLPYWEPAWSIPSSADGIVAVDVDDPPDIIGFAPERIFLSRNLGKNEFADAVRSRRGMIIRASHIQNLREAIR